MKDIINWLRRVEHMAGQIYVKAAEIYTDDTKLKEFFEHTAEDEAWHYHVMGSASEYVSSIPAITPVISIDEQTSNRIINLIKYIETGIEKETLTRNELIDKIVELELSEWNDIFLYTINLLKKEMDEFKYPATRIQIHIKEIEYYLETTEGRPDSLQKIKELPSVWVENILVVDDEEMITDLIKALLFRSGKIDIVHNGKEALKKMATKYYKLIICDVDMPIMDGIAFYKEAIAAYPTSEKRFIFITGYLSPERQAFFEENNVKYLSKPMNISHFREEARKIIISQ